MTDTLFLVVAALWAIPVLIFMGVLILDSPGGEGASFILPGFAMLVAFEAPFVAAYLLSGKTLALQVAAVQAVLLALWFAPRLLRASEKLGWKVSALRAGHVTLSVLVFGVAAGLWLALADAHPNANDGQVMVVTVGLCIVAIGLLAGVFALLPRSLKQGVWTPAPGADKDRTVTYEQARARLDADRDPDEPKADEEPPTARRRSTGGIPMTLRHWISLIGLVVAGGAFLYLMLTAAPLPHQ